MSKFVFNNWDKSMIRLGADRERRRIRRALGLAVRMLGGLSLERSKTEVSADLRAVAAIITDSTRAPKAKRGRK